MVIESVPNRTNTNIINNDENHHQGYGPCLADKLTPVPTVNISFKLVFISIIWNFVFHTSIFHDPTI